MPALRRLIRSKFTSCLSGKNNQLATAPSGRLIFKKRFATWARGSQSSTRRSCHERTVRVCGTPSRGTGKVARRESETKQAAFLHRGGGDGAGRCRDPGGESVGGAGRISRWRPFGHLGRRRCGGGGDWKTFQVPR